MRSPVPSPALTPVYPSRPSPPREQARGATGMGSLGFDAFSKLKTILNRILPVNLVLPRTVVRALVRARGCHFHEEI